MGELLRSAFRYILVIADAGGTVVHREEVDDFMPCYEDLLFTAVCGGALPNDGRLPLASVEPLWCEGERGRVSGVGVSLPSLGRAYGLSVFEDHVRAVDRGSRLTWWLEAEECVQEEPSRKLRVAMSRRPYPITRSPLAALGIDERPVATSPVSILVRREVAEAFTAEAAESLDLERADILTGLLVQEPDGLVAVVVTGRVRALAATSASRAHFAFSPLTFVTARDDAARRADGTTIVGWHHNHPPACGRDCLLAVPPCGTSTLFFSAPHDCAVHRASFPAAYMVGLVSGKEADRRADLPGLRAYGWRDGAIVERELTVV